MMSYISLAISIFSIIVFIYVVIMYCRGFNFSEIKPFNKFDADLTDVLLLCLFSCVPVLNLVLLIVAALVFCIFGFFMVIDELHYRNRGKR